MLLAGGRGAPAGAAPQDGYPFALGVASGDPASDGVVLWTRLAPQPLLPGGGMKPEAYGVRYEVALDEAFGRIEHAYFPSGHMPYLHEESRVAEAEGIARFVTAH